MNAIIDFLNTIFWGYVLIYGLLAVGVFFTVRLGFQWKTLTKAASVKPAPPIGTSATTPPPFQSPQGIRSVSATTAPGP